MEIEEAHQSATWRWPLLLSVAFINICLPNLVLSYGVVLVHAVDLQVPLWIGLGTPILFILAHGLTQCWCREAADSWGGTHGYRIMAAIGLILIVISLLLCAMIPLHIQPCIYGVLGGFGYSLISAQVDAVIFETYDSRLGIIRGICFAGQAVGQSIFPHIITALIEYYSYSFFYIVFAGIMLQTLPALMFLKVDHTVRTPNSFSRYHDIAKNYAMFSNETASNYYSIELQLNDMTKKCWKSPSDDNLHREEFRIGDAEYDNEVVTTITPPPSPEEKRRNIFGVEILPEIPEESETSDEEQNAPNIDNNKKRLSMAIKRLSTLGDNFDDYINKQIRRDSQSDDTKDNRSYTEVEVIYDNISPVTDIQREKIFNSFGFRCQSAYASIRRRLLMPSYRIYRIRRRLLYMIYNINDTFIKPLTRSLSCWRFYPALILSFSKLSLTTLFLVLLPVLATHMKPKISNFETNFLLSLHGFTWICFLLCTPWLAYTPKRNYKYIVVVGLLISTTACFVLSEATDHDSFSIGCVVAGLGFGAITSCWESSVQDFLGARKWPKIHSTLETLSASLLTAFAVGLSFIVKQDRELRFTMFILGIILSVATLVWLLICLVSIYITKVRSYGLGRRRWLF